MPAVGEPNLGMRRRNGKSLVHKKVLSTSLIDLVELYRGVIYVVYPTDSLEFCTRPAEAREWDGINI